MHLRDVDLKSGQIIIPARKEDHDRITVLPEVVQCSAAPANRGHNLEDYKRNIVVATNHDCYLVAGIVDSLPPSGFLGQAFP